MVAYVILGVPLEELLDLKKSKSVLSPTSSGLILSGDKISEGQNLEYEHRLLQTEPVTTKSKSKYDVLPCL